jgi:hypothetical protein
MKVGLSKEFPNYLMSIDWNNYEAFAKTSFISGVYFYLSLSTTKSPFPYFSYSCY